MNNLNLLPSILAFAEVARTGSFTRAAEKLGLSKAALSLQVKRLEEHLGQQLLSRNTRNMSLTTAGKNLLDRSELLQGQVQRALEAVDLAKGNPSGRFALTIPHTLEADIVMPALKQLCREFPLIEPYIHVSDETIDLIDNDLDVAIHGGVMKDSAYKAQLIGKAKEIFCAGTEYISSTGSPKSLDELRHSQLIAAPWQRNLLKIQTPNSDELLYLPQKFTAASNNFASTLAMVKSGLGCALLPEFTLKEAIGAGEIVRVLPDHSGREWPFYYVHRFSLDKPVHVERFYELVKHFFAKATVRLS